MILVDTSVLIDYFKGKENEAVLKLDYILTQNIEFGINNFIFQELLQGSANETEFNKLNMYLSSLNFYNLSGKNSYFKAALINFNCRRKGITVRSTIDLLIVQTAIENNLSLLHKDNDFTNISSVVPELKIY